MKPISRSLGARVTGFPTLCAINQNVIQYACGMLRSWVVDFINIASCGCLITY